MQITNEVSTRKVVGVEIEEYLDYCRERFQIVLAKDGVDEIQAVTESLTMAMSDMLKDRNLSDLEVSKEITTFMVKHIRHAANYIEFLQLYKEMQEKQSKEKEYEDHARSLVG